MYTANMVTSTENPILFVPLSPFWNFMQKWVIITRTFIRDFEQP